MKIHLLRILPLPVLFLCPLMSAAQTSPQLVSALAEEEGLNQANAKQAIEAVSHAVSLELADGRPVRIRGFGKFEVVSLRGKSSPVENTGEVQGRLSVVFVPSQVLLRGLQDPAEDGLSGAEEE